jgi:hypothetical protein
MKTTFIMPPLHVRVQFALGNTLSRLGLPFGWDVATFSWRGHVCASCHRRHHTERGHLQHRC